MNYDETYEVILSKLSVHENLRARKSSLALRYDRLSIEICGVSRLTLVVELCPQRSKKREISLTVY